MEREIYVKNPKGCSYSCDKRTQKSKLLRFKEEEIFTNTEGIPVAMSKVKSRSH